MTRLPTGVWFFPELPANDLVASIAHADRIGLHGVWLGDEGPARDPFAILAAAATQTTSIELGVGVLKQGLRLDRP